MQLKVTRYEESERRHGVIVTSTATGVTIEVPNTLADPGPALALLADLLARYRRKSYFDAHGLDGRGATEMSCGVLDNGDVWGPGFIFGEGDPDDLVAVALAAIADAR